MNDDIDDLSKLSLNFLGGGRWTHHFSNRFSIFRPLPSYYEEIHTEDCFSVLRVPGA
jgi:hypothetical protein